MKWSGYETYIKSLIGIVAFQAACQGLSCCVLADSTNTELSPDLVRAYIEVKNKKDEDFDLNHIIPKDLHSGQDPTEAATKIADKSIQYIWDNSGLKKTSVGKTVEKAQKGMQADVALPPDAKGKKQNLNMGMDILQNTARVKYEGFANAELYYKLTDQSTGVNVVKDLNTRTDLLLGQTMHPSDSTSDLKIRWKW